MGAMYAAGLAVGYFRDLDDLRANWSVDKTWKPNLAAEKRESMYRMWKKAVTRSFDWVEDEARHQFRGLKSAAGFDSGLRGGTAEAVLFRIEVNMNSPFWASLRERWC